MKACHPEIAAKGFSTSASQAFRTIATSPGSKRRTTNVFRTSGGMFVACVCFRLSHRVRLASIEGQDVML